jgi:hypothetical protein
MVSAKYRHPFVAWIVPEDIQILINSISRASVPLIAHSLLRGYALDIEIVNRRRRPHGAHVIYQRLRQCLHQKLDILDARVDETIQDKINNPVLAAEGNRRLGPYRGKRFQALSRTAGKDNPHHFFHSISSLSLIEIAVGSFRYSSASVLRKFFDNPLLRSTTTFLSFLYPEDTATPVMRMPLNPQGRTPAAH